MMTHVKHNSNLRAGPIPGLFLSIVTGCTALGHEVLWTRRLVDLLGCSHDSVALVFGIFFFGLALGSIWAQRLISRGYGPWRMAAISQFCTAVLALPVLVSPQLSAAIWPWLGPTRVASLSGVACKWVLGTVLLLPPSLFTGMTLPSIVRGALGERYPMHRWGMLVYGVNTLGAIAGAVLTTFLLLPRFGIVTSGGIVCLVNMGAGWCAWQRRRLDMMQGRQTEAGRPKTESFWQVLAFSSGFAVMGTEIILIHQLDQVLATSIHSVTIVLALVLFSLGTSACGTHFIRKPQHGLTAILWVAAFLMVVEPFVLVTVTNGLWQVAPRMGTRQYAAYMLRVGGLTIVPIFGVAGMFFPLLFSWCAGARRDHSGSEWGGLLFWNGLGAIAGAETAQFVLMPLAGIWRSMAILAGIFSLAAIVVVLRGKHVSQRRRFTLLAGGCTVGLMVFAYGNLPVFRTGSGRAVALSVATGREGVVTTVRDSGGNLRILLNNSYVVGSTASIELDRQQMILPLLLHPDPRRVGVIGVGTGITAGGALTVNPVEMLECIELSPLVIAMGRQYFDEVAQGLFSDPRSKVLGTDGRLYMAACTERFDLVMADLFVPWREGVARLYTREHFQAVKKALRPGGMFCQWIPLYQLTEKQVLGIIKTFSHVFPNAWMLRNSLACRQPFLGLVGFKDGETVTWEVMIQRCRDLRESNRVRNVFLRHPEGLAMFLLGPVSALDIPEETPLNTLNNTWIEHDASFAFLRREWSPLVGPAWVDFTRRYLSRIRPLSDVTPAMLESIESAQLWADAQKAHLLRSPDVNKLALKAVRHIPSALSEDPSFSWRHLLIDVPLRLPGQKNASYTRP